MIDDQVWIEPDLEADRMDKIKFMFLILILPICVKQGKVNNV
jgi:hypothetical protein